MGGSCGHLAKMTYGPIFRDGDAVLATLSRGHDRCIQLTTRRNINHHAVAADRKDASGQFAVDLNAPRRRYALVGAAAHSWGQTAAC